LEAPDAVDVAHSAIDSIGREVVLVVEDDETVRHLAAQMLSRHGYVPLCPATAEDALGIGLDRESQIDLLLTDVIMPRVSGPLLYERLRAVRPDLKVLYISGYTGDVMSRHGIADEPDLLLQKPFTAAGLTRRIHAILHGAEAAR
jgi:DNA-binding response OmpR family regulator